MRKDFEMFTTHGNAAVDGIVSVAIDNFDYVDEAWAWAADELIALGTTSTYSEADDTAVREAVYAALKAVYEGRAMEKYMSD